MKKRLFVSLLLAALSFSTVGCNFNTDEKSQTNNNQQQTPANNNNNNQRSDRTTF